MAAAALPVMAVGNEGIKQAGALAHDFMAWAAKPFYQNTRTTTRAWMEKDKNGKEHWLTETKTRGFAISNGMLLGILLTLMAYEVALSFAKAWSGLTGAVVHTAEEISNLPQTIAVDATGVVVAIATKAEDTAQAAGAWLWDHLDGKGPVNSSPPSTAVKTATMPSTAMAAIQQMFIGATAPIASGASQIGQKISVAIQNPPTM